MLPLFRSQNKKKSDPQRQTKGSKGRQEDKRRGKSIEPPTPSKSQKQKERERKDKPGGGSPKDDPSTTDTEEDQRQKLRPTPAGRKQQSPYPSTPKKNTVFGNTIHNVIKANVKKWVRGLMEGGPDKIQGEWKELEAEFDKITFEGDYGVEAFVRAPKEQKRYKSVICWDRTRVKLAKLTSARNDFIHANFVNPTPDMTFLPYIVTQGPLQGTCIDFWRMMWQEKSGLIVMLCAVNEENKEKCVQYWPPETGLLVFKNPDDPDDSFYIQNEYVEMAENNEIRVCRLNIVHCTESRVVYHYQYLAWPDKSTPDNSNAILTLHKMVKMKRAELVHETLIPQKSPTVVHCSAGIGRSGVYVAIDMYCAYLTRPKKYETLLDMNDIVTHLRKERARCVQTEAQYFFCYDAVFAHLRAEGYADQTDKPIRIQLPEVGEDVEDDKVTSKLITVMEHQPKQEEVPPSPDSQPEFVPLPESTGLNVNPEIPAAPPKNMTPGQYDNYSKYLQQKQIQLAAAIKQKQQQPVSPPAK